MTFQPPQPPWRAPRRDPVADAIYARLAAEWPATDGDSPEFLSRISFQAAAAVRDLGLQPAGKPALRPGSSLAETAAQVAAALVGPESAEPGRLQRQRVEHLEDWETAADLVLAWLQRKDLMRLMRQEPGE
jgi:hypothetical protein